MCHGASHQILASASTSLCQSCLSLFVAVSVFHVRGRGLRIPAPDSHLQSGSPVYLPQASNHSSPDRQLYSPSWVASWFVIPCNPSDLVTRVLVCAFLKPLPLYQPSPSRPDFNPAGVIISAESSGVVVGSAASRFIQPWFGPPGPWIQDYPQRVQPPAPTVDQ